MIFARRQVTRQASRRVPSDSRIVFRWRRTHLWLLLLPVLVVSGFYAPSVGSIFPIRQIQLSGTLEYLDRNDIESILEDYLGDGFFEVDIHDLQQRIEARPWTESASVRRVWPDRVSVSVLEHTPVARWDDQHLLSSRAAVFGADSNAFAHLPQVYAENRPPAWVLDQFHRLQQRFTDIGEQVVAVRIDNRGAVDVELTNALTIKLGREEVERKITRLLNIYDTQILPRRAQILRLDLRYSNGFAIAWKEELLQRQDEASVWSGSNV